jgi:hypothetical protein
VQYTESPVLSMWLQEQKRRCRRRGKCVIVCVCVWSEVGVKTSSYLSEMRKITPNAFTLVIRDTINLIESSYTFENFLKLFVPQEFSRGYTEGVRRLRRREFIPIFWLWRVRWRLCNLFRTKWTKILTHYSLSRFQQTLRFWQITNILIFRNRFTVCVHMRKLSDRHSESNRETKIQF